jgi:hypothetical protein
MTDAALSVLVLGVIVIAVAVDLAALLSLITRTMAMSGRTVGFQPRSRLAPHPRSGRPGC